MSQIPCESSAKIVSTKGSRRRFLSSEWPLSHWFGWLGRSTTVICLGQDVEKELELQISMRQEMELAMKMLEKDVCEKQDALVSLRQQLDDLRALKHELAFKLQVGPGPRDCRAAHSTTHFTAQQSHVLGSQLPTLILRLSYSSLLLFLKIMATFHIGKENQTVFLSFFFL